MVNHYRAPQRLLAALLTAFFLVMGSVFVLKEWILPSKIKTALVHGVLGNCPEHNRCKGNIEGVSLTLLPLGITLKSLSFEGRIPGDSFVTAQVKSAHAEISFFSLFSHHVRLKSVDIEEPQVTLTEGSLELYERAEESQKRSNWTFESDLIGIKGGEFTYLYEYPLSPQKKKSSISVHRIQATVDRFGTAKDLQDLTTHAHVKAVLERSGRVDLSIAAVLHSPKVETDVTLALEDQKLAELNSYFDVNDGISLQGKLIQGLSTVAIRDRTLHGSVQATYEGLRITFRKTRSRGRGGAFFSTFLSAVLTNEKNTGKQAQARLKKDELNRLPKESLVSFILRGMKVAAMEVTKD